MPRDCSTLPGFRACSPGAAASVYQAAPSSAIGFEDGEPTREALREAEILRRLVARLDAAEVAELLGLTPEEVARIAAAGEAQGDGPG
jgi:hypothetical protein